MIRASAYSEKTGRRIIILGLEEGNVDRLREGKPIHIHADELGFAGEIIILLGKDTNQLHEMFKPLLGHETNVRDERTRQSN